MLHTADHIPFHQVSQWHSEYDTRESDKQFDKCLKSNGSGVSIASFFHICKEYWITLSNAIPATAGDSNAHGKYESQESAPYGLNPYSGEIFDERGYPAEWDFHLN